MVDLAVVGFCFFVVVAGMVGIWFTTAPPTVEQTCVVHGCRARGSVWVGGWLVCAEHEASADAAWNA